MTFADPAEWRRFAPGDCVCPAESVPMVASEFRAALRALGIRQNWLAGRLGVSPVTVSRWVRGELDVPQYAVFALALLRQLAAKAELQ